jgi:hypothetical protein
MPPVTRHKKLVLALFACGALNSPQLLAAPTEFHIYLAGIKSAAALSLSPGSINFGNVPVGQSASSSLIISNTGGTAAANLQYVPSTNFSVSGECGSTLAANSQCVETVTFTPTAGQAYSGNLTITNGTLNAVAGLSGTGLLTADQTSLSTLNFGNETIGVTSAAQSVQLANTGNTPVTINQISTTGPYSATQNCGSSLAVGGTCTVNVTFTPTTINSNPGVLSFNTNAGTQAVTLSGNGQGAVLGAAPTSLAFGNVGAGQSATQSFTLTNSGNLAATSIAITPPSGFTQTSTCGSSLAAQASCSVSVTFSPTATTSYGGNLQVTSSASTLSIPVSGTGTCASGSQIFTSNGTFTPKAGCSTYLVLAVGGGGGGANLNGGQGGGGGGVAVSYSNGLSSPVAVTVGGGGAGSVAASYVYGVLANYGTVGASGGTSCFGSICAGGGGSATSQGQYQSTAGSGGTGGGGAYSMGSLMSGSGNSTGGPGGTNGGAGTSVSATVGGTVSTGGSGQGAYASYLALFKQNSVTAGAGGTNGIKSYCDSNWCVTSAGGGGGGVVIAGSGPTGAAGTSINAAAAGQGGQGYGGGGGGSATYVDGNIPSGSATYYYPASGAGTQGVVYVEWSQ